MENPKPIDRFLALSAAYLGVARRALPVARPGESRVTSRVPEERHAPPQRSGIGPACPCCV